MKATKRIIISEYFDIIEVSVNSINVLKKQEIENIKYSIEGYLEGNITGFKRKTGIHFKEEPTDVSAIILLNKNKLGSPEFEEFELPLLEKM